MRAFHRRRWLGACAAGLLTAGCDLSLRHGVFNACNNEWPAHLREHALVLAAWRGLDAAKVWDVHCHVFGRGDSDNGLWFNPRMEHMWRPVEYLQRQFYINAACVHDAPRMLDASFVDKLVSQSDAMPSGFRAMLFAFDWARDENGAPLQERSTFYVPDDYVAGLAQRHPARFEWAASVHPYDPRALERLDIAAERGARAIKWLPSAQGIDPASARCDRFYAKLAKLRMPVITHAGDERAVHGFGERLGNPLKLRRALDAGVRVVVAHCASLGVGNDLDRSDAAMLSNFELFARLMDDPRYRGNLVGDVSAITQGNRMSVIPTLLARHDWHDRLLNGSDYPLPGVVPLIPLHALADKGLLEPAAIPFLAMLREHNVLLFDFVLKRALAKNGVGFPPSVFETRGYFSRTV